MWGEKSPRWVGAGAATPGLLLCLTLPGPVPGTNGVLGRTFSFLINPTLGHWLGVTSCPWLVPGTARPSRLPQEKPPCRVRPPQPPGAPWDELLRGQALMASSENSLCGRAWPGATWAWTPTGPRAGGFAQAVCRGAGSSCTPWSLACACRAAPCCAGSGVRSWGTTACAGREGHPQLTPEDSGQPRHTPAVEPYQGELRAG